MKLILATVLLASNVAMANTIQTELNFNLPPLLDLEQNLHTASINGRIVKKNEPAWAHSVYLEMQSEGKGIGICSGTIIAKDTILTAAHCFSESVDSVKIVFGRDAKTKNETKVISDVFLPFTTYMNPSEHNDQKRNPWLTFNKPRHDRFQKYFDSLIELDIGTHHDRIFDSSLRADIALVFFEGGYPKGSTSAKLYHGQIPMLKEKIYSYGYGIDRRNLNKVKFLLRESKEMVFAYYLGSDYSPRFLLAYSGGDSKSNVCSGDSGGGTYFENKLTKQRELIAITNISSNECADFSGHLFVYPFLPWIEQSIKEYRARNGI